MKFIYLFFCALNEDLVLFRRVRLRYEIIVNNVKSIRWQAGNKSEFVCFFI